MQSKKTVYRTEGSFGSSQGSEGLGGGRRAGRQSTFLEGGAAGGGSQGYKCLKELGGSRKVYMS